ncbi:MAG: hypothetical protein RIT45_851 [Pseudomonadota bacterium]
MNGMRLWQTAQRGLVVVGIGAVVSLFGPAAAHAKGKAKGKRGARVATAEQTTPLDQYVAEQKGCEGGWKTLDGQRFVLDWPKSGFDGALVVVASCGEGAGKYGVGVRLLDGTSSFSTELAVNQWSPDAVKAVLVRDVNGDGVPDVVLAATAMTGVGPTGAQPFAVMDALVSTPDTSNTAIYRAAAEHEREAMAKAKNVRAAATALERKLAGTKRPLPAKGKKLPRGRR